jgi:tetratricopeptide (TPR) repeat protein
MNRTLRDAVEAHRAALLELTRTNIPQDWAATQSDPGMALFELGNRGDVISLHKAIEAFEGALTEIPRDHMPIGWALQKANVAKSLQALGDAPALERSIAAYETALEVFRSAGEHDIAAQISDEIEIMRRRLSTTEQQSK